MEDGKFNKEMRFTWHQLLIRFLINSMHVKTQTTFLITAEPFATEEKKQKERTDLFMWC